MFEVERLKGSSKQKGKDRECHQEVSILVVWEGISLLGCSGSPKWPGKPTIFKDIHDIMQISSIIPT